MKTDRVNSGGKEVLLGHVNELSLPAQSCSEQCLCDACATWVSQGSYLCSITGPQVTACILPTTATKKKKSLCILGSCRPFRLFCIYGTWKKCSLFLPWAPYFPHWSLWTCYPAAPIIFSTQSPTSTLALLEDFPHWPYFLNILLFLWFSGTFPISRASCRRPYQADSKQSDLSPTWLCRTCISTALPSHFNSVASFRMLRQGLCTAWCEHGACSGVCRSHSQTGSAVSGGNCHQKQNVSATKPLLHKKWF